MKNGDRKMRSAMLGGEFTKIETVGLALIAVAAFAFLGARIVTMSIVHDEALTAAWSINAPVVDIVLFRTPGLPDNNHLLFTLLAKISVAAFGNAEWAMRLPSLLAFGPYSVAMALILRRHLKGALFLLFFAAAIFNPGLLEVMSIARGYGLAIALSVAGAFCLLKGAEVDHNRRGIWWTAATAFMTAATLAHLTVVLFLVMAGAVMIAIESGAITRGKHSLYTIFVALVGPAIICASVAPILGNQVAVLSKGGWLSAAAVDSFGWLNAAAVDSFHERTVVETVQYSLNDLILPPWLFAAVWLSVYAILAVAVVMVLSRAVVGRGADEAHAADLPILLALVVGASLLSVLQHYIADVGYLYGRRAFSMYPFFILTFGALAGAFWQRQAAPRYRVAGLAFWAFLLFLLSCFASEVNLDKTMTWKYDADTRDMMSDLRSLLAHWPSTAPARMGITWIFEPSINYYRLRNAMSNLAPVDRSSPVGRYDLYFLQTTPAYVESPDITAVQQAVGPLTIIKRYPRSGAVLAVPTGSPLSAEAGKSSGGGSL